MPKLTVTVRFVGDHTLTIISNVTYFESRTKGVLPILYIEAPNEDFRLDEKLRPYIDTSEDTLALEYDQFTVEPCE